MLDPRFGERAEEVEKGVGLETAEAVLFQSVLDFGLDFTQELLLENMDLFLGRPGVRVSRADQNGEAAGPGRRSESGLSPRTRPPPPGGLPSGLFESGRLRPREKPQPRMFLLGTKRPASKSGFPAREARRISASARVSRRRARRTDGRLGPGRFKDLGERGSQTAGRPGRPSTGPARSGGRPRRRRSPARAAIRSRPRLDQAVLQPGLLDPGPQNVGIGRHRRFQNGSSWPPETGRAVRRATRWRRASVRPGPPGSTPS